MPAAHMELAFVHTVASSPWSSFSLNLPFHSALNDAIIPSNALIISPFNVSAASDHVINNSAQPMYTLSSHSNKTISSLTPSKSWKAACQPHLSHFRRPIATGVFSFPFNLMTANTTILSSSSTTIPLSALFTRFPRFWHTSRQKTVPKHLTQASRSFHALLIPMRTRPSGKGMRDETLLASVPSLNFLPVAINSPLVLGMYCFELISIFHFILCTSTVDYGASIF